MKLSRLCVLEIAAQINQMICRNILSNFEISNLISESDSLATDLPLKYFRLNISRRYGWSGRLKVKIGM